VRAGESRITDSAAVKKSRHSFLEVDRYSRGTVFARQFESSRGRIVRILGALEFVASESAIQISTPSVGHEVWPREFSRHFNRLPTDRDRHLDTSLSFCGCGVGRAVERRLNYGFGNAEELDDTRMAKSLR
jgi:hypothetical protein